MTYVNKYKCIAQGTTPAMRRFLATHHHDAINPPYTTKLPNPRDAALQALTIDAQYANNNTSSSSSSSSSSSAAAVVAAAAAAAPKSIKLSLHVGSSPSSSLKPSARMKRVCSTPGCHVEHTPIWWNVDDKKPYSENKICQRCHLQKIFKK
jgi:hypothetical protein